MQRQRGRLRLAGSAQPLAQVLRAGSVQQLYEGRAAYAFARFGTWRRRRGRRRRPQQTVLEVGRVARLGAAAQWLTTAAGRLRLSAAARAGH